MNKLQPSILSRNNENYETGSFTQKKYDNLGPPNFRRIRHILIVSGP